MDKPALSPNCTHATYHIFLPYESRKASLNDELITYSKNIITKGLFAKVMWILVPIPNRSILVTPTSYSMSHPSKVHKIITLYIEQNIPM